MKVIGLLLCMVAVLPLHAGRRRAAVAGTALSIEFVDVPAAGTSLMAAGSDAWLDVSPAGQRAGSTGKSARVQRQFGIRIVRAGGTSWGTALVTARLQARDGRSVIRIDGQTLASMPIVVSRRAEVGTTIFHTLEIDVPDSVPAGPLEASISWEVTTQ